MKTKSYCRRQSEIAWLWFIFVLVLIGITACMCCSSKAEVFGGIQDLGLNSAASKDAENYSCDSKPPAKPPAQMSGGEGVPPLPLPAVPLRRTEKKNAPRPPVLVIKIRTEGGDKDWNTNPSDIDNLLKWLAKQCPAAQFSTQNKTLDEALQQQPTGMASK